MNIKDIKNVKKLWAFEKDFAVIETTENKSGIINRLGEVVLEPKDYDMAFQTEDGLFALDTFNEQGRSHRIYFNAYTREVIPHDVINLRGKYYVEIMNNQYGLCDREFHMVLPPQYDGLVEWNGRYMARKNNKWGLISANNVELIPFQYDDCTFSPGQYHTATYQCVSKDGEYFYINEQGKRLTTKPYEYLEPATFNGLAIMKLNGCFGLIDRDENIVLTTTLTGEPTKCLNDRCFYWCGYNRLAFRQDGLLGIMDTKGNIIVEPQYDFIKNFYKASDQRICVTKDGKQGYIDLDGNVIIPCEYSYIGFNHKVQTHTVHTTDGKWGLLNAIGETILPAVYDAVSVNETYGLNEIAVSKDGRCYFINDKQEEVKVF